MYTEKLVSEYTFIFKYLALINKGLRPQFITLPPRIFRVWFHVLCGVPSRFSGFVSQSEDNVTQVGWNGDSTSRVSASVCLSLYISAVMNLAIWPECPSPLAQCRLGYDPAPACLRRVSGDRKWTVLSGDHEDYETQNLPNKRSVIVIAILFWPSRVWEWMQSQFTESIMWGGPLAQVQRTPLCEECRSMTLVRLEMELFNYLQQRHFSL